MRLEAPTCPAREAAVGEVPAAVGRSAYPADSFAMLLGLASSPDLAMAAREQAVPALQEEAGTQEEPTDSSEGLCGSETRADWLGPPGVGLPLGTAPDASEPDAPPGASERAAAALRGERSAVDALSKATGGLETQGTEQSGRWLEVRIPASRGGAEHGRPGSRSGSPPGWLQLSVPTSSGQPTAVGAAAAGGARVAAVQQDTASGAGPLQPSSAAVQPDMAAQVGRSSADADAAALAMQAVVPPGVPPGNGLEADRTGQSLAPNPSNNPLPRRTTDEAPGRTLSSAIGGSPAVAEERFLRGTAAAQVTVPERGLAGDEAGAPIGHLPNGAAGERGIPLRSVPQGSQAQGAAAPYALAGEPAHSAAPPPAHQQVSSAGGLAMAGAGQDLGSTVTAAVLPREPVLRSEHTEGSEDEPQASSAAAGLPYTAERASQMQPGQPAGSAHEPAERPTASGLTGGHRMDMPHERARVVEQVLHHLEAVRLATGRQEMTMQLRPEYLGQVHVELRAEAHAVTAIMVVDNAAARDALHSGRDRLAEALAAQGYTLGQMEVSVGNRGDDARWQAPQTAFRPDHVPHTSRAEGTREPGGTASGPPIRETGRLDYWA